ncbi:MAG TPA: ADP-forming succinate--CoA ligase subunit beta [Actinomycetota bacterium]|nr:ADP-forming succinate--CoA ligase subunit beta [Actinomycetota bacterium]
MDLFEYQGKELFARAGIPVPAGRVARTPEQAVAAAAELAPGAAVVIKAQVATGGRGKAGGVKVVPAPAGADAVSNVAAEILALSIKGEPVGALLVEAAAGIEAEYYAAVTFDRRAGAALFLLSATGGMEVEEAPEGAMASVHVDPLLGLTAYQVRDLVFTAGLAAEARTDAFGLLPKLYRLFVDADASLVEINPLALTASGQQRALIALDAKVTVDDSALYRHPDIAAYHGTRRLAPQEELAAAAGLNFVKLDGDVGIIGNGAGLVMSTLDVVSQAGGAPANFLDVGGGAGADVLSSALEVVLAGQVRSVLVNIFGGITRGDAVAGGILEALGRTRVEVPIVVRLEGTNATEGRAMLAAAHHPNVRTAGGMMEAARMAVEAR